MVTEKPRKSLAMMLRKNTTLASASGKIHHNRRTEKSNCSSVQIIQHRNEMWL